ncbi:MAG: LysE family translocator [Actinomycetes bacterium]
MVSILGLLAFAGVAVVLVAVPGPSVVFTISRALTCGRRTALLNVAGNTLGLVVQVVAVAFGLGAVIERSAQVFTGLKLAGAAYLVWLGVQAIRHRRSLTETIGASVGPLRPLPALRDGVVVGVTNPKSIAVFVVVMPRFAAPGAGHLASQLLVLGLVFALIALVLDSCWALAAGTARQWLSGSPRRLAAIGGAGGLVMIGLGVGLATTGRKD